MAEFRFLIDTNVLIGLEDPKVVPPVFAEFARMCGEHRVGIFVHQASLNDIARDKDESRRKITLSKIEKFQQIAAPALPAQADLVSEFGDIRKPNDWVDVALIYAVKRNIVDFLVTDDLGIHSRLRGSVLADRVFGVTDALGWLRRTFGSQQVSLPFIEELKAYQIDIEDEIFESLREGYEGFDHWWQTKCVEKHRLCWVAKIDHDIAGLVVRKQETRSEASIVNAGNKILKICTFKVRPEYRGEKLGELLLKQVIWFAQKNGFELIYVTTFPIHAALINLLEYFGFQNTFTKENGELVFEKLLSSARLIYDPERGSLFDQCRLNYPRFIASDPAKIFCVPIKPDYHKKLFPELARAAPLPLFPLDDTSLIDRHDRKPGNTIRKVYLCHAQTKELSPGDLLVFYQSKDVAVLASQALTAVGVVENVLSSKSLEEVMRVTAKRSVFSETELREMVESKDKPLKLVNFLLCGHIEPPITLAELLKEGVFRSRPPLSIAKIPEERFASVRQRINLGFDL